MKKIVFTGGGTLGHVMPNVYLMEELNGVAEFAYVGSKGIEKDKMTNLMEYHEIPTVKLQRGKIFANLKIPFVLINSIFKAKKILKKLKPDLIFSKGGYVSLPVCVAGKMLKIPIVAHESDYSFGLANKVILKTCNKMCVNFKNLEGKNKKVIYTGPIFSKEFESNKRNTSGLNLDTNKKTILIVGGSLGSKSINEALFPIIKDLLKDFNIIHVTGKGNNKLKSFDNYNALESSSEMANLYNLADFVIGRSGAGVTAECFFKKLPMLLIPLEKASRGDQLLNAKYYEKQQVASILHETNLTPTKMLNSIRDFSKNLTEYKNAYSKINPQNGKNKIIKIVKEYLK